VLKARATVLHEICEQLDAHDSFVVSIPIALISGYEMSMVMTATDAGLWLTILLALGISAIALRAYGGFLRKERAAEEAARAAVDSAVDYLRKDVSFANLLDFFRRQIDQFHIQGRRRANWSFAASLIAMFGGLALIGVAIFYAVRTPDHLAPSAAAVSSAALMSFIVKTFVETSRQADRSLDPLFRESSRTLRFLMAPHLVASLKDSALTEQAVEALVEQFLKEIRIDSGPASSKRTNHARSRSLWTFR
jgi:hypothetical protein